MFQELEPLELNEHTALLLRGSLERERKRLRALAVSARDRSDREAWALYDFQWFALAGLARRLGEILGNARAPSDELLRALAVQVRRKRRRMPRSKANAAGVAAARA